MKKSLALILALIMVLCLLPVTALAANGTGHQISVKIYKVVLDSSKPLGYQTPELLVDTITVICQDKTSHSGYNHSVNLKEFYPTNFGLTTTDWTGWQFNGYYEKGKDKATFYDRTREQVNATANVTGSEPYPCSKNFYLVYKEAAPQTQDITLTYDANGGSGAPASETKNVEIGKEATFIVNSKEPTRANYDFKGWSTKENATTASYNGGDNITISKNTTLYAVWENTAPQKPSNNDIPDIVGSGAVKVECVTYGSGHGVETYELIAGSYDVGKVEGDATTGYTCKITVHAEEYVNKYNNEYTTTNHRLKKANESSKVITLKYENNAWTVLSGKPVTFEVECTPIHTDRPSDDTVKSLIGNVEVECSNKEEHTEKEYELISGSYSIGDVAENECVITIAATEYVKKYNDEIAGHRLADGESDSKTVTLKYEFGAWKLKNSGEVPVKFFVTCAPVVDPSKPEKPSDDAVEALLGGVVTIDCTNNKVTHEDKTYGLLTGGFSVGDVEGNKETGYTCDITVNPDKYVEAYNGEIKVKHILDPVGQTGTIKLRWKPDDSGDKIGEWKVASDTPVVFKVVCETGVTDKVTVRFNSNGGTDVAPQTINKGEKATRPTNPTKDGYTFVNWYLEGNVYDFSKPVTEDITLHAQWEKNDDNPGQDPNPDPSPKPSPNPNPGGHDHGNSTVVVPITVYMPPKTGDMPFWYSIAQFLGLVK